MHTSISVEVVYFYTAVSSDNMQIVHAALYAVRAYNLSIRRQVDSKTTCFLEIAQDTRRACVSCFAMLMVRPALSSDSKGRSGGQTQLLRVLPLVADLFLSSSFCTIFFSLYNDAFLNKGPQSGRELRDSR